MKVSSLVLGLVVLVSCGKEVVIESVATPTPTATPATAPLGGVPTWRRDPPKKCPIASEIIALGRVQGNFMEECLTLLQRKEVYQKECVDMCILY